MTKAFCVAIAGTVAPAIETKHSSARIPTLATAEGLRIIPQAKIRGIPWQLTRPEWGEWMNWSVLA